MSTFLSDLERELRDAHPRRRAARRRATARRALRAAPLVMAVVAVLAGAGVFLFAVSGEGTRESARPGGEEAAPPAGMTSDHLPRGTIAVLNATKRAGLAGDVADYLRPRARLGRVGNSDRSDAQRTVVHYAPGFRNDANLLAARLGPVAVRPLDRMTRDVARTPGVEAPELVVEVGSDIRGANTADLRRFNSGTPAGTAAVLDRRGPRDIVTLRVSLGSIDVVGLWLVDRGRGPQNATSFGVVAPPPDSDVLDHSFAAPRAVGRRLVLGGEVHGSIGELPRRPLFVADL